MSPASQYSDTYEKSPTVQSKKRSSKACDECRRTKSRCDRISAKDDRCHGCASAGVECTYISPSFKRGPPKGYIHALEERRRQLELILGAIIACPDPHAQAVISALNADDLAKELLSRVDAGPYGEAKRGKEPSEFSKEDSLKFKTKNPRGTLLETGPSSPQRQPRQLRERVSAQPDHLALEVPASEWQATLIKLLESASILPSLNSAVGGLSSPSGSSASTLDADGIPLPRRRRVDEFARGSASRSSLRAAYPPPRYSGHARRDPYTPSVESEWEDTD